MQNRASQRSGKKGLKFSILKSHCAFEFVDIVAQLTNDVGQEPLHYFGRQRRVFLFDLDIWIVGLQGDLTDLLSVEGLHSFISIARPTRNAQKRCSLETFRGFRERWKLVRLH